MSLHGKVCRFASLILFLMLIFLENPLFPVLAMLMIWMGLMILGSIRLNWGYYLPVIHSPDSNGKIYLSFDDGPHPEYTPEILNLLQQEKIQAFFACIGRKVDAHSGLVKKIAEQGHILVNHSYQHDSFLPLQSVAVLSRDIRKGNMTMAEATGTIPELYRPPYGVSNPLIAKAVKNRKMKVLGWDVRSMDGSAKFRNTDAILRKTNRKIKNTGGIVLLHDCFPDCISILAGILQFCKVNNIEIADAGEVADKI